MPVDKETGVWVPQLSAKQFEVYNEYRRFVLVSGPRLSGKTTATLHRLMRHAWETDGARIAMFAKSIKLGQEGIWLQMTGSHRNSVLSTWKNAMLQSPYGRFKVLDGPKIEFQTRASFVKIQNYWGTESVIKLHSLDYDGDVEEKLFSTMWSCIYFSELQHFHDKGVFDRSIPQLRMDHLKYEQHMWIADTNPPEEADEHFAYDIFFRKRTADLYTPEIEEKHKDDPETLEEMRDFQKHIAFHEIQIKDNPFLDKRQFSELKNAYMGDPEGWARFIEGKWTRGTGHKGKHFSMIFSHERHVVGDASDQDEDEWDLLNPLESCVELITGWDIGTAHHAAHIIQRRLNNNGQSVFDVLDECVSVGEQMRTDDFALEMLDKINGLEEFLGKKLSWVHWADTSSFRFQACGMDPMDYMTVDRVTEGKVILIPATDAKGKGSVRKRVQLIKQLLREGRINISAHCFETIEMFKELRKGHKETDYVLRGQRWKHAFDSLSYAIYAEMLNELEIPPDDHEVGTRTFEMSL